MVPRACDTRFLKIVFDLAEIFDFETFPISPIKNPNFENPSRNLSDRTKVKILKKKFLDISQKKIWFRVCSVTAEMFEHRNSGENRRKRRQFFFENLRRAYKDLI